MELDVIVRFLWSLGFLALGLAAFIVARRVLLRRHRNQRAGLENALNGIPAILYFTTPSCVPCKTIQRPALSELSRRLGDRLQIIEVDAVKRPDVASAWHVMSVPTTYILDTAGLPRHVNFGVAGVDTLLKQLQEIQ